MYNKGKLKMEAKYLVYENKPYHGENKKESADINRIDELTEKLAFILEKHKVAEYVILMNNTKTLAWKNFVSGMAKGLGMALGLTILAALILYILQLFVKFNVPVIGHFIAQIVQIVQTELH